MDDRYVRELLERTAGLPAAIVELDLLADAVWEVLIFEREDDSKPSRFELGRMRPFHTEFFQAALTRSLLRRGVLKETSALLLLILMNSRLVRVDTSIARVRCLVDAANPLILSAVLLGALYPEDDIKYFVVRRIREKHGLALSHQTALYFRSLAELLNMALTGQPIPMIDRALTDMVKPKRGIVFRQFRALLDAALSNLRLSLDSAEARSQLTADAFVDACRLTQYLRPHFAHNQVSLLTKQVDSEYLLSNIFGLPSGIQGFDDLFGGGGILLGDSSQTPSADQIRGRVVLTVGRFGTGKTILALQMAVSIARKGGIVWLVHFEQTRQEYLYTLRSMTQMPTDGSVEVLTDSSEVAERLASPKPGRGLIILLGSLADSYGGFLDRFRKRIDEMAGWPLQVVIVDSLNAIRHDASSGTTVARAEAVEVFNFAKNSGSNVWLIAEEGLERHLEFWKNIADTVIRLSVDLTNDALVRYIEVMKSRLQREQPGRHVITITPGAGLRVIPSTSAVRNRLAARSLPSPTQAVEFGHKSIDLLLGPKGLVAGDLLVVYGPSGTHKG